MNKLYVPIFSFTLFLSAFLLFAIQPLFSKMVLPYLGGSSMVWNTSMVFFQGMLLAGYGYAYFCSKIPKLQIQLVIHGGLFLLFLSFLPFSIQASDIPSTIENPAFWQIGLMFFTIGAPFFILSGCAPLLQRWFSHSNHKDAENPYFLYAASNVGSLLALLSYPIITEPLFDLSTQVTIWSSLYAVLILFIVLSGISVAFIHKNNKTAEVKNKPSQTVVGVKPNTNDRLLWLMLSFIPSSLLLGVTTFITTDVASVPLLWILPLAIYVGSFVIAFASRRPFSTDKISNLHAYGLVILMSLYFFSSTVPTEFKLVFHLVLFAIIALSLHMRLVDYRPSAAYLTEFYFFMSLGGVLGGIFNALISPVIFDQLWEYSLILILSAFFISPSKLMTEIREKILFKNTPFYFYLTIIFALVITGYLVIGQSVSVFYFVLIGCALFIPLFCYNLRVVFGLQMLVILLMFPVHNSKVKLDNVDVVHTSRNFYGVTKIVESEKTYGIMHGTTLHGQQYKDPARKLEPVAYYDKRTSIGEAILHFTDVNPKKEVAVLGLGAGGMACYTMPGRTFNFYEIDPDVIELATNSKYFSYLKDCGNPYKIIMGDARLKILQAEDKNYDMILMDVFSSDNIPVHLMTEEAISSYLQKLKDDGVLLIHISNRHLDLRPVLATIADSIGAHFVHKAIEFSDEQTRNELIYSTNVVLISKQADVIEPLMETGWSSYMDKGEWFHWTDSYANILNVLNIIRTFSLNAPQIEPISPQSDTE